MSMLVTNAWTHLDPVEGCVQVVVTESSEGLTITKNGSPVSLDSPEALVLIGELRKQKIRDALAETYLPEGVEMWLAATHKGGPLAGRCPKDMIANGEADTVLAAAESLSGQIAT